MPDTATASLDTAPDGPRSRWRIGVVAAFLAAVALGVGIGLAATPADSSSARSVGPGVLAAGGGLASPSSAVLAPPRPSPPSERHPGRARLLHLTVADRLALRRAYYEAYLRGRAGVPQPGLRFEDSVVQRGSVYYGEITGTGPSSDTLWAVGRAYFTGPRGGGSAEVNPHAWKRVGGGNWEHVAAGREACAQVPWAMIELWGRPACAAA